MKYCLPLGVGQPDSQKVPTSRLLEVSEVQAVDKQACPLLLRLEPLHGIDIRYGQLQHLHLLCNVLTGLHSPIAGRASASSKIILQLATLTADGVLSILNES